MVSRKVCLRCKGKTLLGDVNKLLKTKSLLTSPQVNFPAKKLNFHSKVKVMRSNPGSLLKSFLLSLSNNIDNFNHEISMFIKGKPYKTYWELSVPSFFGFYSVWKSQRQAKGGRTTE